MDPADFHLITRELDSCPTLQGLATILRSELEVIKVERRERRQQAEVRRAREVLFFSLIRFGACQIASTKTVLGTEIRVKARRGNFQNAK